MNKRSVPKSLILDPTVETHRDQQDQGRYHHVRQRVQQQDQACDGRDWRRQPFQHFFDAAGTAIQQPEPPEG
jgi:hypothetical protein